MEGLKLITLALIVCLVALNASAHNNTVVIPMFGDPPPPEAVRPLAPVAPLSSNYNEIVSSDGNTAIDKTTGLEWQNVQILEAKKWDIALDFCRDLNTSDPPYAGKTGWRLPTLTELASIVDYGAVFPALEQAVFSAYSFNYWSASNTADDNSKVWGIHFFDGTFEEILKTDTSYVRCVRGPAVQGALLRDNGSGTVTDLITGLIWQQHEVTTYRKHAEAVAYCNGLTLAGKSDWRVPNIKELASIVDHRRRAPAINVDLFQTNQGVIRWSATSKFDEADKAWGVFFGHGNVDFAEKTSSAYVRCVRSEK